MKSRTLVFTDLDGTLLDHENYHFDPAMPMIQQLKEANVPIIPVTSKTRAEVMSIMRKLHLRSPFVVENGAAVFIPEGYFSEQPEDTILHQGFWVHALSEKRGFWIAILAEIKLQFPGQFTSFSSMSVEDIANATGLSIEEAYLADCREYSEPILWLGDKKSKAAFKQALSDRGLSIVEGGRFMHFAVDTNKGQAVKWLIDCFKNVDAGNQFYSIGLGDGENDVSMLQQVDQAILIRSPNHPPLTVPGQDNLVVSVKQGPAAWHDELQKLSSHWA